MQTFGISQVSGATLVRQGTDEYFRKTAEIATSQGVDPRGTASYIINNPSVVRQKNPDELVMELKSRSQNIIENESEIAGVAQQAIDGNPKAAQDYKNGKEASIQVLIGAIMEKTQGKANAQKAKEILIEKLKSND